MVKNLNIDRVNANNTPILIQALLPARLPCYDLTLINEYKIYINQLQSKY